MTIYHKHGHTFEIEKEVYRETEYQDGLTSVHLYYTGKGFGDIPEPVTRKYCGDYDSTNDACNYIRNCGIGAKI